MVELSRCVVISEKMFVNEKTQKESWQYKIACDQGEFMFYSQERIEFPDNRFSMKAEIEFRMYNGKLSVNLTDIQTK